MRAIIFNFLAHTMLPINYAIAKYLSAEIPIFSKDKIQIRKIITGIYSPRLKKILVMKYLLKLQIIG